MQVPFIKFEKKTLNKIEQAKIIVRIFSILTNIKVSESELLTVAYFMVYGFSDITKDLIIKSRILANEDSYKNTMSKLKKLGLIFKFNKENRLNANLDIKIEPIIGMLIKLDNKE